MNLENFSSGSLEKSKKELAYDQIKELIITHKLKPGTLLVERQLCAVLNTSRTPVREAIQQLASEGLVTNIPSKGSLVSEIRYEDIARLYEVREYLEGLASRLCALNITDTQFMELQQYYIAMAENIEKEDYEQLLSADISFHKAIINNSRNDLLINICNNYEGQVRRITLLMESNPQIIAKAHAIHKELLVAIANRDAHLCENLMREHIRFSKIGHLKSFAPSLSST